MSEGPVVTGQNQEDPRSVTWFKPGQSGNPRGRTKGARSKLGEAFLEDMLESWEQLGMGAILDVIQNKPDAYLKVMAMILPKQIDVKVTPAEELSDDELTVVLNGIRSQLAEAAARAGQAGGGSRPSIEAQPAEVLHTIQ